MSEQAYSYPPGTRVQRVKCWPEFFEALWDGRKRFEVRKNDRDYQLGDVLQIREWRPPSEGDPEGHDTGRVVETRIGYILRGGQFGIDPDYCVIGFAAPNNTGL